MTIADLIRPNAPPQFRYLISIAVVLATAFGLAAVGAFGTYLAIRLPVRLLHFSIAGLLIGSLAFALTAYARRRLFGGALPYWTVIVIAAGTALPGALIVHLLLRFWAPHVLPHVSYAELTAQVLIINLFVGSAAWILRRHTGVANDNESTSAQPEEEVSDTLRSKLPLPLRHAAILSLSAEDHYVRVRTNRGEALILINLSAAVAALGSNAGVRIHRSHWVTRELAAHAPSTRQGIRIGDDTVLPVSRAGRKLLNAI